MVANQNIGFSIQYTNIVCAYECGDYEVRNTTISTCIIGQYFDEHEMYVGLKRSLRWLFWTIAAEFEWQNKHIRKSKPTKQHKKANRKKDIAEAKRAATITRQQTEQSWGNFQQAKRKITNIFWDNEFIV